MEARCLGSDLQSLNTVCMRVCIPVVVRRGGGCHLRPHSVLAGGEQHPATRHLAATHGVLVGDQSVSVHSACRTLVQCAMLGIDQRSHASVVAEPESSQQTRKRPA